MYVRKPVILQRYGQHEQQRQGDQCSQVADGNSPQIAVEEEEKCSYISYLEFENENVNNTLTTEPNLTNIQIFMHQ